MRPVGATAFEKRQKVRLDSCAVCIEHLPLRHDHDIDSRPDLVASEDFAREPLGAIPHNGGAELLGGRHAKTTDGMAGVGHEDRHEPGVPLGPGRIHVLELWAFEDAQGPRQPLVRQVLGHGPARLTQLTRLALVSDSQALAPLRSTPLEHEPAILGSHSHSETMRLRAATFVGLVGSLALHGVVCTARPLGRLSEARTFAQVIEFSWSGWADRPPPQSKLRS